MHTTEALGDPCCNCGSRQIVVEPAHLSGACAQCSAAVTAERRWNERIAKAASRRAATPQVQYARATCDWILCNEATASQARPLFGRLPRRQSNSSPPIPTPQPSEQLTLFEIGCDARTSGVKKHAPANK
jgi:hypothetical protein